MRVRPTQFLALALAAGAVPVAFGPVPAPPADGPAADPVKRTELARAGLPWETLLRPVAKRLVIEDVAAGRLTLPAAAVLFRELDRLPPAATYPDCGDFGPPPDPTGP